MTTANVVIIAIGVVLTVLRASGHKSQAFQAAAHLFVGGLLAAWLTTGGRFYLWNAIALSVVEVACFVVFKVQAKRAARRRR